MSLIEIVKIMHPDIPKHKIHSKSQMISRSLRDSGMKLRTKSEYGILAHKKRPRKKNIKPISRKTMKGIAISSAVTFLGLFRDFKDRPYMAQNNLILSAERFQIALKSLFKDELASAEMHINKLTIPYKK